MKHVITASILLVTAGLSVFSQEVVLKTELIDNFDAPAAVREWIIRGSRYSAEEFPRAAYIEDWPKALHGFNKEGKPLNVLGVEAAFTRRGYNYLEIIPSLRDEGNNLVNAPIELPAYVNKVGIWVWGSNYDYTLEVHLRDYRGIVHVLPMGRLRYHGWRHLSTDIPGGVPQVDPHSLQASKLEILKFVLWTEPRERSTNFFVYFDELRASSDRYLLVGDGDKLSDRDLRQDLWDAGQRVPQVEN